MTGTHTTGTCLVGSRVIVACGGAVVIVEESHADGEIAATGRIIRRSWSTPTGPLASTGISRVENARRAGSGRSGGRATGSSGNTGNTNNFPHLHFSVHGCNPVLLGSAALSHSAAHIPEHARQPNRSRPRRAIRRDGMTASEPTLDRGRRLGWRGARRSADLAERCGASVSGRGGARRVSRARGGRPTGPARSSGGTTGMTRTAGIARAALATSAIILMMSACVDTPDAATAPSSLLENSLALSFDGLSQESFALGDLDRGLEFKWTALALRGGVSPSRLELRNDGVSEAYEAFVHTVVKQPLTSAPPAPFTTRTLVAWRATSERLQVLMLVSPTATSAIAHPARLSAATPTSPVLTGHAAYFIRGASTQSWLGVSGTVKLAESQSSGVCESAGVPSLPGVSCTKANYQVAFDVRFSPSRGNTRELDAATSSTRAIIASEQRLSAGKLVVHCERVSSVTGCG